MGALPVPDPVPTRWAGQEDAAVLGGLAQQDEAAMRELHRRYAPALYALAHRAQVIDPDRCVQDAFMAIWRHAECHSRSRFDGRTWMLILAHQSLRTG
ncbi:hypothetical protein [Deinococcus koreensis]|nr:hypothetical protein [Deinococcus koreensis]